jgi:hopanoid biosynthesis associated protein HpnK
MSDPATGQRVIFNADDFGRSHSINEAVIRAHREGVLTTASLMVNGEAFDEAVQLARQHPSLGVGLHLTLVMGRSSLSRSDIPGLVNDRGEFTNNPVAAGMKAFFHRSLRPQLEAEIAAQIDRFDDTGLLMDHLNGHLNFHLHPTIFQLLMRNRGSWELPAIRLTRDPFWLNARIARGQFLYRLSHALIFGLLCARAHPALNRAGLRHTDAVFGLQSNGRVTEEYLLKLLPRLPTGDVEIYSHPCVATFPEEFAALTSPFVMGLTKKLGIRRCRYQDL